MAAHCPVEKQPHVVVGLLFTSILHVSTELILKLGFVRHVEMPAGADRPTLIFREENSHQLVVRRRITRADSSLKVRPQLQNRPTHNCLGVPMIALEIDACDNTLLAQTPGQYLLKEPIDKGRFSSTF